jgi:hypothetical protein
MNDDLDSSSFRNFVRPAMLITGCILAVALVLLPVAVTKTGSGGPLGLAAAAAVCLAATWCAEGVVYALARTVSPLGVMLLGMAFRMAIPLGICLKLAARGASGRAHLAFIAYLLVLYLATLALETWLTVKRVAHTSANMNRPAR